MDTVEYVDLTRFMGDWHVLADVATPFDKKATQPLEHYQLNGDGTIATTYSFVPAGETERRNMRAKGYILDAETNATWGMQFVWPIKADYRVVYLDEDYQTAVIGRQRRDFVWIMARQPRIPESQFRHLLEFVENLGYDLSRLRIHMDSQTSLQESQAS